MKKLLITITLIIAIMFLIIDVYINRCFNNAVNSMCKASLVYYDILCENTKTETITDPAIIDRIKNAASKITRDKIVFRSSIPAFIYTEEYHIYDLSTIDNNGKHIEFIISGSQKQCCLWIYSGLPQFIKISISNTDELYNVLLDYQLIHN